MVNSGGGEIDGGGGNRLPTSYDVIENGEDKGDQPVSERLTVRPSLISELIPRL